MKVNLKIYKKSNLLYLSFLLVLVFIIVLCVRFLLAEIYLNSAKLTLKNVQLNKTWPESIKNTEAYLSQSAYWRTNSADMFELTARLKFKHWRFQPDSIESKNSLLLKDALTALDKAISIRPKWPLYRVSKARIYGEYLILNEGFYSAFDEAFKLGRYESNTALNLLKLGLSNWHRLSDVYRERVLELMHLSLHQKSNSAAKLWLLVDNENLGSWFCLKLPKSDRRNKLCSYR